MGNPRDIADTNYQCGSDVIWICDRSLKHIYFISKENNSGVLEVVINSKVGASKYCFILFYTTTPTH